MENRFLNSREIRKIKEQVIQEFGYFWQQDYAYLLNENQKLFVINKDIKRIDLKKLRIDKIGLYVAEVKENQVRLSKEGAQLLAQEAEQRHQKLNNLLELTKQELKDYFHGSDLNKDLGTSSRLVILHYQNEIIGCARYKEGRIINFLPKLNRGEVII